MDYFCPLFLFLQPPLPFPSLTISPPPPFHHHSTTNSPPPSIHHHQSTTTSPPLHHHQSTTTSPPLHQHFTTTSPPLHHHFTTTEVFRLELPLRGGGETRRILHSIRLVSRPATHPPRLQHHQTASVRLMPATVLVFECSCHVKGRRKNVLCGI